MSVDSLDSYMDTAFESGVKLESDPDLADIQKVDVFARQLPNFSKVKVNAFQSFNELKHNLSRVILLNEIRPGFFDKSPDEYDLFFTKEDHIRLVKLYIQVILTPDIDLPVVDLCFQVLTDLLK